jgi:hypothetical protein
LDQIEADINDTDQNKAGRLVLGLISQEYLSAINEQDEDAAKFDNDAHAIWNHYMKLIPHESDGSLGANGERVALPPFARMKVLELEDMIQRISNAPPASAGA